MFLSFLMSDAYSWEKGKDDSEFIARNGLARAVVHYTDLPTKHGEEQKRRLSLIYVSEGKSYGLSAEFHIGFESDARIHHTTDHGEHREYRDLAPFDFESLESVSRIILSARNREVVDGLFQSVERIIMEEKKKRKYMENTNTGIECIEDFLAYK